MIVLTVSAVETTRLEGPKLQATRDFQKIITQASKNIFSCGFNILCISTRFFKINPLEFWALQTALPPLWSVDLSLAHHIAAVRTKISKYISRCYVQKQKPPTQFLIYAP